MKTHDNRVLFSKALLKAATCLFLTVGAGMSPVFALPGTAESMKMEITQQTVTVSGVVKRQERGTYHWCQYHGKRNDQRYHYRF
mgnify:CR=1 FL=1